MENFNIDLMQYSKNIDSTIFFRCYPYKFSTSLHINYMFFFYKHIKFSDEARLCLSYHKIKAGVMLTVYLLQ